MENDLTEMEKMSNQLSTNYKSQITNLQEAIIKYNVLHLNQENRKP